MTFKERTIYSSLTHPFKIVNGIQGLRFGILHQNQTIISTNPERHLYNKHKKDHQYISEQVSFIFVLLFLGFAYEDIRWRERKKNNNNDDKISLLQGKVLFIPPSLLFCCFFCVCARQMIVSFPVTKRMRIIAWNEKWMKRIETLVKRNATQTQSRTNEWWWTTVDHRKLSLEDKTDKGSNEVERLICIQLFHYIDILCQRFVHCIYFRTTQRKERIERNERKIKTCENEQRLWDFVFTITFFFDVEKCFFFTLT